MYLFHKVCGTNLEIEIPKEVVRVTAGLYISDKGLTVSSLNIYQDKNQIITGDLFCKKCCKNVDFSEVKVACGNCGDPFAPQFDDVKKEYSVDYFQYLGGVCCPRCTISHESRGETKKVIKNIFLIVYI